MSKFNNLKIRSKLIFLVLVAFIAMTAISSISFYNLRKLGNANVETYERVVIPNAYLRTITNSFATIRVIIRDFPIGVLTDDTPYIEDDIQTIIDNDKIIEETFALYSEYVEKNNIQGEEKEYINGLMEQYKPIKACVMSINDIALTKEMKPLLSAILDDFDPINTSMRNTLNSLNEINNERAEKNNSATVATYNEAFGMTIITIALSVLLLIVLAALTILAITKPINRLVQIADDVSNGNLNVNMGGESKDELGVLAGSFKVLVENLRKLIEDLNHMSEAHRLGDLDFRIDANKYRGAYAEMADGANSMIDDYISMIQEIFTCFDGLSNGDFNAPIKNYPGKKELVTKQVNMLRENLRSVGNEITMLARSGARGELSTRADVSKFRGDWKVMLAELNNLLDHVVSPIREVRHVLAEISDGNLDAKAEGSFAGEFSLIKDSLDKTSETLKAYISEISYVLTEIAGGNLDLEVKREYIGDFSLIKTSLNTIINDFNQIVHEINASTNQVTVGVEQLAESSRVLANGTSEQASAVEELSETITRIKNQSNRNTETSVRATVLSNATNENATRGSIDMEEMVAAMDSINEASNKISKVIKVIDDIAFQTNLLALNAAVEAARAGVHGKGFAVVSEEVRELANKSKSAAQETTLLIEDSIDKVTVGTKIANKTAAAFNDIKSGVTEITEIVDGIKTLSAEQASSISQVSAGLNQISDVVQNTSATSEESSATSQELSKQAELLKNLVVKFKLRQS